MDKGYFNTENQQESCARIKNTPYYKKLKTYNQNVKEVDNITVRFSKKLPKNQFQIRKANSEKQNNDYNIIWQMALLTKYIFQEK